MSAELDDRSARRRARRIAEAKFPPLKRLADFNADAVPTINPAQLATLAGGAWIESGNPVVLLGDSGTGKTHLLIGLGIAAREQGLRVRYITTAQLARCRLIPDRHSRSTSLSRRSSLVGDSDERTRMDGEQPVDVLEELLATKSEHGAAAGVAATSTSPTVISVRTTAYVIRHVSSALDATNQIAYTNMKNAALTHQKYAKLPKPVAVTSGWSYGIRHRTLYESANGRAWIEDWVRTSHGQPTLIVVNYRQRWWERNAFEPGPSASLCRVPPFHLLLVARNAPASVLMGRFGTNGRPEATKSTIRIHFRWLSPTRTNLAKLTGTIPPGFHQETGKPEFPFPGP